MKGKVRFSRILHLKKISFFQTALKLFLEGIFRCDFFKTSSTHRDTSIAHVFHDFVPPVAPIPPYRTPGDSKISKDFFCILQRKYTEILTDFAVPRCSIGGYGGHRWSKIMKNMRNRRISMSTCGLKKITPKNPF